MAEKFKAAHIPMSELQIGNYRKVSIHEGDLVAKFYYARKKLVWETLDHTELKNKIDIPLKNKIEIQWEDILSMKAIIDENNAGTLMIELNRPPTFFQEMDPQPRKHTKWEPSWDFTQNQASSCRRHMLKFPPRELDKHYEKLIQIDSRLKQLSQDPFPRINDPYFCTISQTNLSNGYAVHESVIGTSAPLLTNPIQSLTSDGAISPLHEAIYNQIYNQRLEDPCHPVSSQRVNDYDVHGFFPCTSTTMLTTHQVRNPIHELPTAVTNVALSPLHGVIHNQRLEDMCPLVSSLGDNGYDVHGSFALTPTLMPTADQVRNSIGFPTTVTDVVLSAQRKVINSQRLQDMCPLVSSLGDKGYDVHGSFTCSPTLMLTPQQVGNSIQFPATDIVLPAQHNVINSQRFEDSSIPILSEGVNGNVDRPFPCTIAPMPTTHQVWNPRKSSTTVRKVARSPLHEAINSHTLEDSSVTVSNQLAFETFRESIDSLSEANHEEPHRVWTLEDLCKFLDLDSETVCHERHITGLPREEDPAQNINTITTVDSRKECTDGQCSDEERLLQPQPQPQAQPPQSPMSFVYLFLFVVSFFAWSLC